MSRVNRKELRLALSVDKSEAARVQSLCEPDALEFNKWLALHLSAWAAGIITIIVLDPNNFILFILSAFLGSQLHALTVLQHDCGHRSAYNSPIANRWVGRLLALLVYLPFTAFTGLHRWHHGWLGDVKKDPDEWFYAGGKAQLLIRECLFVPRFIWLSLSTDMLPKEERRQVAWELAFNTGFALAFSVWMVSVGETELLVFGFALPMAFLAFIFNPVSRGYEHWPLASLPHSDERRFDLRFNTVTVTSKLFGLLWANITYHVEHHMYPRVPCYRLPELHKIMREKTYHRSKFPLWPVRQMNLVEVPSAAPMDIERLTRVP